MFREPISNDPANPLVSVFIYNYHGEHLECCFESIFSQKVLENIEIILIDNASTDGSWQTALDYARRYQGILTIKRNKRPSGLEDNLTHCWRMAKGKYYVTLINDDVFVADYVKHCIQTMEKDPFSSFEMVKPRMVRPGKVHPGRPNVKNKPLVSVLIHNYNYGRYLKQCLESVTTQTYDNIEIIFSDNASTDESWEIVLEFARSYPGMMTIIRNRRNFGPSSNLANCYANINGKYFCVLCSDDAFKPEFVQKCVNALEAHPDAGFAMVHRAIIDSHGLPSEEPPFYSQSCVIPGAEQAAVYMMAAVNPSISQIMYSQINSMGILPTENMLSRWFGQRILDFGLCCEFSMVYLKEPLLYHRVHESSDSSGIASSLVEIFAQYILPHQFSEMACAKSNMGKAIERLPQALEKLGSLCLRYCVRALGMRDERCAFRYFHLAAAILPEIINDPVYLKLQGYWPADASEKSRIVASLEAIENLTTRNLSYDPPPGWIPINGNL